MQKEKVIIQKIKENLTAVEQGSSKSIPEMLSAEAVHARFEMLADIRRVRETETLNARLLTYLVFPNNWKPMGFS